MTSRLKAQLLFQILSLAPMKESEPRFRQLRDAGDVEGIWSYYAGCLRTPSMDEKIEMQGLTSFRMLKPAMEAIYSLRST